jgi:hypothetical protein
MVRVVPSIPTAAGIAIFRYRLCDIDRIIDRTLVYGPLTALLAATYLDGGVTLQLVFRAPAGQGSQLAAVASTLAMAMAAPFVRCAVGCRGSWIGVSTEASTTPRRPSTPLPSGCGTRDGPGYLLGDLVGVVEETIRPAHASLWLMRAERGGTRILTENRGRAIS